LKDANQKATSVEITPNAILIRRGGWTTIARSPIRTAKKGGGNGMNKLPGFGLIERARTLAPLIAREADEIERARSLTEPVVSALIDNGLYRVLLPHSLGGAEAPPEIFMQMLEEVAKADASTAWCLGQCSVCAMIAAYLDADAAREIFNTPPGILAWGAIANEVQVVPGGYRANARWDFASGSRQASWLGAHVRIVEANGTPRLKTNGAPEVRTILFPVTSATMYDVWDVIGLRGTGTDSYSVDNLFVPDKFAALRDDPKALREKGPLYKMSTNMVFSMGFAATSIGVARATLDAATDLARGKTPQGLKAMRDNNAVQGLIGRTEAALRAARAYLYTTATEVWRDLARGDALTEQHRIALRIAATWTIHQSASVVDTAYHMAGATAVFSANKFERRFRDMHTIAQQIQARDTHYEDAGKAILFANLGTPPTAR
jgi:alkylation response protein AidB-like acyl-CoA dehydrogenase